MRFLFILTILFLMGSKVAFAQVEISEIMYDLEGSDAKREWIEVQNNGGQDVDLSTWKIYEGTSSSKGNRSINEFQGGIILASGLYAVIASDASTFLLDWPSYTGQLFDSTFSSLTNTGEPLVLRDENLVDIDTVNYQSEWGASGDGNSLQLISGEWLAGSPTPGTANAASVVSPSPNESDEPTEEEKEVGTTPNGSSFPIEPQISARAGKDRIVIVGADAEFKGEAFGLKGEPLVGTRYQWNMGNGELKEGKAILHAYHYPGEYVVTLTVSSGQYAASDRLIVTATEAQVNISKASVDFIELRNGSNVELNLSWWKLKSGKELFTIPKDTIILAGKTLVFSNEVTKFTTVDSYDVALLYPNGVEAYYYKGDTSSDIQTPIYVEYKSSVSTEIVDTVEEENTAFINNTESIIVKAPVEEEITLEPEQDLNDAQIAASLLGVEGAEDGTDSSIYKWLLALISIISIAAIGVLLGRRQDGEGEIKILD